MRVVALVRDLILASRIEEAARAGGAAFTRVDAPEGLPAPDAVDLLLVDWTDRRPEWAERLGAWRDTGAARVIVFGPHTDLAAHAEVRRVGLGPMWARSRLVRELPALLAVSAERS